jgi:hypothetical protein
VIRRVLYPLAPRDLQDTLGWNPDLSMFQTLMNVGGYYKTLVSRDANMTFLVPDNAAFEATLAELNITFNALLKNESLVTSIVSSHIMKGCWTWNYLYYTQQTYFDTCNSCGKFWTEDNGEIIIRGGGNLMNQINHFLDTDLVAGIYAKMHIVNEVFIPGSKGGRNCNSPKYSCQEPS